MSLRISVHDLSLARGDLLVASGIGFALGGGAAMVVRGPNGSGKSTLLAALAGLLSPFAGTISEGTADQAVLIGHQDGLKPQMSVAENLEFWASYAGCAAPIDDALSAFGLTDLADVPAGMLSQGQKRRCALARALISQRPLWLMDEPATALDDASLFRLADVMAHHRAAGGIIIAATHGALDLPDAQVLNLGAAA